jgi:2-oxoisovalerate dehydrogenase E2 component (dihydrolipoyl transacylase)
LSQHIFKMPDLGEGTVEAEIVAWHIRPGDEVTEDRIVVEVMTDKAAVEVPSPVSGRVVSIAGVAGDKIPVGAPLIVFELAPSTAESAATTTAAVTPNPAATPTLAATPTPAATPVPRLEPPAEIAPRSASSVNAPRRVMVSPANRRRAREAGIDLAQVVGTGPGGRIVTADLAVTPKGIEQGAAITEIKVIGLRRVIAERMSEAKRTIPHFSYVEEVDITELEALRRHLNETRAKDAPSLTLLPLVIAALCPVLVLYPQCNVLHDAARGVLVRHHRVHVGIATQTPDGLKVPVVRDAHTLGLLELAAAIKQVTGLARSNKAAREQLSGSTITVTSLGKLGGIASTPIINSPEVAIIGLNKAVDRPVVRGSSFQIRHMMNLSSSFDHRFVDGFDAAAMIQELKQRLEHPATIFIK